MSEILVGSVEPAAQAFGMTGVFVGVIVVAIIGNAAEHSTAILAALKNRMDLSHRHRHRQQHPDRPLRRAGARARQPTSSGPSPMDLVFTPPRCWPWSLPWLITGAGRRATARSNWLEGVQLLAVYVILAMVFYFLPEVP